MTIEQQQNEDELFRELNPYKMKFFGAVEADFNSFIELLFYSHGNIYEFCFFNNYPDESFHEVYKYSEKEFLNKKFMKLSTEKVYKIPIEEQEIHDLKKTNKQISCELFKLDLRGTGLITADVDLLKMDDKYLLDNSLYNDVMNEIITNYKEQKITEIEH